MNVGVQRLKALVQAAGSNGPEPALDQRRWAMERYAMPPPDGLVAEVVDVAGVPGEWIYPAIDGLQAGPTGNEPRVVLMLHGGGYETGSVGVIRRFAGLLAQACEAPCLTIDYRLAPEHPCPAAVDDGVTAYRWLLGRGVAPRAIVVAGESAGGGLAVALLLRVKSVGDPMPGAAVLIAPWVDLALTGESITSLADVDFMLTAEGLRAAAVGYAGTRSLADPLVSPLHGDLEGLPPLLIQVGGADILRDDSVRLTEPARAAGVDVQFELVDGMPHCFPVFAEVLPEGADAVARVGEWVRARN